MTHLKYFWYGVLIILLIQRADNAQTTRNSAACVFKVAYNAETTRTQRGTAPRAFLYLFVIIIILYVLLTAYTYSYRCIIVVVIFIVILTIIRIVI